MPSSWVSSHRETVDALPLDTVCAACDGVLGVHRYGDGACPRPSQYFQFHAGWSTISRFVPSHGETVAELPVSVADASVLDLLAMVDWFDPPEDC